MMTARALHGYPPILGALSLSSIISQSFMLSSVASLISCYYFLSLICSIKGISSSPCIGLVIVTLLIKRGESLFRGEGRTYFQDKDYVDISLNFFLTRPMS
jgi:hypothetical protein